MIISIEVHTISMASNKITGENSNVIGGDDHFSEVDETIPINPMVLLVRIEHVDGRAIEPEILTETTFLEAVYTRIRVMSHMQLKF